MPELGNEETEHSLVSADQRRDPVSETAEEFLGLERLSLTAEDEQENSKYLASVVIFGNQMMLELMKNRLSQGQKPKRGDPVVFTIITDYMNAITAGYHDTVNKDNFPTKYGNMLVKYSDLIKACSLYAESRDGKKHFFSSERQIEKKRLQQVTQISQIAQREMMIIRQRSGILANSEDGITWKALFQEEGQKEQAHFEEATILAEKQRLMKKAVQPEAASLSDTPAAMQLDTEASEAEPTIEGLQKELKVVQEKCASIQKALERLLTPKTKESEHTERADAALSVPTHDAALAVETGHDSEPKKD